MRINYLYHLLKPVTLSITSRCKTKSNIAAQLPSPYCHNRVPALALSLALLISAASAQLATDGTVKSYQKISDTQGNFTATLDNSDYFGQSVAALGDVDGHGIPDLAVGANLDDDGSTDRGAVYILFLQDAPPAAPTNLTADSATYQVTLTWAPNTEPDLSHYVAYMDTTSGFTPTSADSVARVNKPDTSVTITGLSSDTTFFLVKG